jgi:protease PrsW
MTFLSSFFAAIIPMSFYLILLWKSDKNERESFRIVIKHFLWGAFGAIILGIIFSFLFESTFAFFVSDETSLTVLGAVIVAPFVEEITKGVFLIRSYKKNYFDDITDGLVYGGAIGLGFGMTENLMYFTQYNDTFVQWASLVLTRTVFSAVMHAISTATFGAFLAKSKFTITNVKFIYPVIGLLLAMSIHFIWNFTLTYEYTFLIGMIFMLFLIATFILVFRFSLKSEQKLIFEELKNELGNFGQQVYDGKKFNFISNDKIQNKLFQNFATKLAFRKFQSRNSLGIQQENYLADVKYFRNQIKNLLNKNDTINT